MLKYYVYQDASGQFRWRSEAGGNITSNNADSHHSKAYTIRQAKKHAAGRPVFWWDGGYDKRGRKTVTPL